MKKKTKKRALINNLNNKFPKDAKRLTEILGYSANAKRRLTFLEAECGKSRKTLENLRKKDDCESTISLDKTNELIRLKRITYKTNKIIASNSKRKLPLMINLEKKNDKNYISFYNYNSARYPRKTLNEKEMDLNQEYNKTKQSIPKYLFLKLPNPFFSMKNERNQLKNKIIKQCIMIQNANIIFNKIYNTMSDY